MLELLGCSGVAIVLLGCLALAAWFWGADSRDASDHPEWERRQSWFGGRQPTR
jgi:nitrogen fixation-related uncharacterized protein